MACPRTAGSPLPLRPPPVAAVDDQPPPGVPAAGQVTALLLAARDGEAFTPGTIPDGFYLVDDTERPQPAFQQAIIDAVARVTHIAEADTQGELIGSPMVARGVIRYALREWGLCTSVTGARYTTTTEVYPDSPRTTPEQCNLAQTTAVCAALDFLLARPAEVA